jgi:hypothetical protein
VIQLEFLFFSSKFNRTLFLGEAIAELKCPCKSYKQLENSSRHVYFSCLFNIAITKILLPREMSEIDN